MSGCFGCFCFFRSRQKAPNIKQQLQNALQGRYKEFLHLGGLLRTLFREYGLGELDDMLSLDNNLRQGFSRRVPTEGTAAGTFFNRVRALTEHLEALRKFSEQKQFLIDDVTALEEKEIKALQAMDLLADIPLPPEATVKAAAWQKDYRALCKRLSMDFDAFRESINQQIASTGLFPKGVDSIVTDYYYLKEPSNSV